MEFLDGIIQSIGDYTADAILITKAEPFDGEGPEIVWCNRSFEEHSGYTLDEIKGQTPRIMQTSLTSPESRSKIRSSLEKWEPVRIDMLNQKKDGTEFWVELSIMPVADDTGWYRYWVSVQRDVTDRVNREKELQRAREKAEQAARAKDCFMAVMSHEIRTPLNGLMGMLSLIDRNTVDADTADKLSICDESAKNLATLLNDVLDLTKIETGNIELEQQVFDIRDMTGVVDQMMQTFAHNKDIETILDIDGVHSPILTGDPVRLRQIVGNLVSNAVKFTEHGSVSVKLWQDPVEGGENPSVTTLYGSVTDTGTGIPADKLEIIFERFEQVDTSIRREHDGPGVGLAICRQLARKMGGDVTVTSTLGKGSTFDFRVVLGQARQDRRQQPSEGKPVDYDFTEKRVMIVEDHPINQLLVKKLVTNEGMTPTVYPNGAEALEALSEGDDQPDIILCDIHMPILDGYGFVTKLRASAAGQQHSTLPVIAVTADEMAGEKEKCLDLGFTDYVPKPIDKDALFEAIANSLAA